MKRKVGDKVIIKSIDWWDEQLKIMNADTYGVRDEKGFYFFVKEMTEYCSKKAFIEDVRERFYRISIDGRMIEYYWEDWMFEDSDEKFDYFEFTKENLRELVWNGKGKVVDQDGQIIYLNFPADPQMISMRTNFLFETKFPLEIRVPKEKKKDISVCQFKPFEKVLVRNEFGEKWQCNLFDCLFNNEDGYNYSCIADSWKQCIPYEGNENLVGRTENPPSYGN